MFCLQKTIGMQRKRQSTRRRSYACAHTVVLEVLTSQFPALLRYRVQMFWVDKFHDIKELSSSSSFFLLLKDIKTTAKERRKTHLCKNKNAVYLSILGLWYD